MFIGTALLYGSDHYPSSPFFHLLPFMLSERGEPTQTPFGSALFCFYRPSDDLGNLNQRTIKREIS